MSVMSVLLTCQNGSGSTEKELLQMVSVTVTMWAAGQACQAADWQRSTLAHQCSFMECL